MELRLQSFSEILLPKNPRVHTDTVDRHIHVSSDFIFYHMHCTAGQTIMAQLLKLEEFVAFNICANFQANQTFTFTMSVTDEAKNESTNSPDH